MSLLPSKSTPVSAEESGSLAQRLARMPLERRLYALAALPRHLAASAQDERLRFLLSHFDFLQAKLEAFGIRLLIADYERTVEPVLPLILRALQKASHILEVEPAQLWTQLYGRLMTAQTFEVKRLLSASPPKRPWLRPLGPTLEQAAAPLQRTIPTRHTADLRAVAMTPDGALAITASADHCIKIWNLVRGTEIRTLHGHRAAVDKLALVPDGSRLLSASHDGELRLWNLDDYRELAVIPSFNQDIAAVAVTPDGNQALISLAGSPAVQVWDLLPGRLRSTLLGHTREVTALAVTPDGHLCVSASDDGTLRVWNLERGETLRVLAGHQIGKNIHVIALTGQGRFVVSASWDKTIRVWDLQGDRLARVFPSNDFIMSLAVSSDGRRAVSVGWHMEIWLWDFETGSVLARLIGHTKLVRDVAMTPDGRCAVSVADDRTLLVWDLQAGAAISSSEIPLFTPDVRSVSIDAAGERAVSASQEGVLTFWDVETCQKLHTVKAHTDHYVWSVDLAAEGNIAVSSSMDGTLKIWDVESGQTIHDFRAHSAQISSVSMSSDGRYAVTAAWDKTVKLWATREAMEVKSFPHEALAVAVAFLGHEQYFASTSARGVLRIWEVQEAREIWRYNGVLSRPSLLAAAAARTLVAFVMEGSLQVWDFAHDEAVFRLALESEEISTITLSRGGSWLVIAGKRGNVMLWDVNLNKAVAEFWGDSPIEACALAPEVAPTLILGEASGRVHLLRLE